MREVKKVETEDPNIFKAIPRKHKKYTPINRDVYECSRFARVSNLDMKDDVIRNIPRAGIMPYAFINGELHRNLGRDRLSRELTDYGGTRKVRLGETPVQCAVREGNEESRFAFGKITIEQVQDCICLYSKNMLIIFIPVMSSTDIDVREVTKQNFDEGKFLTNKQKKDRRYNEISEIVWLNEEQFNNIFTERPTIQMYNKVRQFMYSCNNLSQNIDNTKYILKTASQEGNYLVQV